MTAPLQKDPARRALPFEEWPEADRILWEQALHRPASLDAMAPAAQWSEGFAKKIAHDYGRWLGWLQRNGRLAGAPAERVTPEAVAAYLAALRKQVNERTVLIRLDDLYIAIAAMAPGDDWTWFQLARSRLRRRQPPARAKGARLADPPELLAAACTAMDELLAQPRMTQWKRVRYRDLLMVALLTSRPIRRRNFASLEIGRHLARQGAGWKLRLEATETFNHRAYEAVLPAALTQYLEIYLEQIRPMLLCGASSERLWINWRGGDLDERSFWLRLTLQTSALTGKSQSPELFRAAAAAAIARQDPNHAGVVREVLGNASIDAAENLADRSRRIDAGRTYREAITALRNRPNRSARRKS